MPERYTITGGSPVTGEIACLGAKNFATKAMIAAILSRKTSRLTNMPDIGDVQITLELLTNIGVQISWDKKSKEMVIDPAGVGSSVIKQSYSGSNRMPVLLLGTLLHFFDTVSVPVLGGCTIGARQVDFHLDAIQRFGGTVTETADGFTATKSRRLKGAHINLTYPSVGATETCLYLSVLAEGTSVIRNAAIEPEILELITMLRAMGAVIFTDSGREIRVEGVKTLAGTTMHVLGDRIEAASWASLAAASDGSIVVRNIRPETLGNFLSSFRQAGGGFDLLDSQTVRFFREAPVPRAIHIETDVYPGFSTDWQQPFAILLTQAQGVSIIHETVYENRFGYLEVLKQLGADVQVVAHCLGNLHCRYKGRGHNHSAIIKGPTKLKAVPGPLIVPDLRAGLAYIIVAALAEGTTTIEGISMIERGYGNIVPRLQALGLRISRVGG